MRSIASRKTSTSEAKRVKMDGGCIKPNNPNIREQCRENIIQIRKQSLVDDESNQE